MIRSFGLLQTSVPPLQLTNWIRSISSLLPRPGTRTSLSCCSAKKTRTLKPAQLSSAGRVVKLNSLEVSSQRLVLKAPPYTASSLKRKGWRVWPVSNLVTPRSLWLQMSPAGVWTFTRSTLLSITMFLVILWTMCTA